MAACHTARYRNIGDDRAKGNDDTAIKLDGDKIMSRETDPTFSLATDRGESVVFCGP